jgi:hypothetical protein
VPSTKEVQGKPPGEEQSKYQEHLIKLKQEHHQHHNQLPIEASTVSRYTLEIAYHERNHGKNQDSCINKINSKKETPHHQTLLPSAVLRRSWGYISSDLQRSALYNHHSKIQLKKHKYLCITKNKASDHASLAKTKIIT